MAKEQHKDDIPDAGPDPESDNAVQFPRLKVTYSSELEYSANRFGDTVMALLDLIALSAITSRRGVLYTRLSFEEDVDRARAEDITVVGAHYGSPLEITTLILTDAAAIAGIALAITKSFKNIAETGLIKAKARRTYAEAQRLEGAQVDWKTIGELIPVELGPARQALATLLSDGNESVFLGLYGALNTKRGDRLIVMLGSGTVSVKVRKGKKKSPDPKKKKK